MSTHSSLTRRCLTVISNYVRYLQFRKYIFLFFIFTQHRLLEQEQKDEDRKFMQKYCAQMNEEDLEMKKKREMEKFTYKGDLDVCTDELTRKRELEAERDRVYLTTMLHDQKEYDVSLTFCPYLCFHSILDQQFYPKKTIMHSSCLSVFQFSLEA